MRPGRMRPPLPMVIWPAFTAVPVVGKRLTWPQLCVGLQLPGRMRLMVNVCVRVAKCSRSIP